MPPPPFLLLLSLLKKEYTGLRSPSKTELHRLRNEILPRLKSGYATHTSPENVRYASNAQRTSASAP